MTSLTTRRTRQAEDLGKGEDQPDISPLLAAMKTALGARVSDVRSTARLTESAVVLGSGGAGPDLAMQRLMRRAGRAMMPAKPVLEVNPRHKLIESLSARLDDTTLLLQRQAAADAGDERRRVTLDAEVTRRATLIRAWLGGGR